MILVLTGTKESRDILDLLQHEGLEVMAAAFTDYGRDIAQEKGEKIFPGELNFENLSAILEKNKINFVIDASNPFATQTSKMISKLCQSKDIAHVHFVREEVKIPNNSLIHTVTTWQEGADKAFELGNSIFLTTGTNNLEIFLEHPSAPGKRIVVRVLPDHKVLKKCQDFGLKLKDIIAMQGPFSKEMNRVMFKTFNAGVVVIKESGRAGGTDTKISAALELKIPLVIIKRPTFSCHLEVKDYLTLMQTVKKAIR
ncbi:precorrin-6A reductase [Bacillota bacterium LX-D]|nr:precorrin-6A reductase [Bacillota bacterium LX-D]